MKSIVVNIDEKDLDELGILSEHISLNELERKLLIRSIKKQREELEKLNIQFGFDKLSEEEIFNEVNEAAAKYNKGSKNQNS